MSRLGVSEAVAILGLAAAAFAYKATLNVVTARDGAEARRKLAYCAVAIPREVLCTAVRYRVTLAACRLPVDGPVAVLPWVAALWPLTIFESQGIQFTADRYSQRPVVGLCATQAWSCLRVAVVEAVGMLTALHQTGFVDAANPGRATAATLLRMLWMAPVFDCGLDLGFYVFHRACHESPLLYRLVHKEHHTDTAKRHGRLVAYETYTLTWAETFLISFAYLLGFAFVFAALALGAAATGAGLGWPRALTAFEFAMLITWGHTVELVGHTAISNTPKHHPMRAAVEWLGLDLLVIDHTMHHRIPLSNYSKRMTFWDVVCGTYSPRDENVTYQAGDEFLLCAATAKGTNAAPTAATVATPQRRRSVTPKGGKATAGRRGSTPKRRK